MKIVLENTKSKYFEIFSILDLDNINEILNKINEQTLKPNKIFLNIPYRYKRFKNEIVTEEKIKKINAKNLQIKRCDDYGPGTKIMGSINEVKKFNNLKVKKSLSANKLIGVQEINDFLKKSISLEQCKELINIKTRQYAKRQNTWARGHMKNWNKLYSKNFSNLLKKSLKVVS